MLRDVFYFGEKPNVHPRERLAKNLDDARRQATTEHFWVINEFCDYKNFEWDFDFDFLPDEDVWAEEHNNVWPSIYQKDSGTWLCNKNHSDFIVYRNDVTPLKRKNIKHSHWVIPDNIDQDNFDFGWHPDPTDPPYIYQFGTQWQKTGGPKYVIKDATQIKYVNLKAKALPTTKNWTVPKNIDIEGFDFSWHPDESSPPYIYVFSTQWAYSGGPIYTMPGATEVKYLEAPSAVALPDKTNWIMPEDIDADSFDFSWHPFSEDDPCIYQIGTQHQKTGGPRYIVPGVDESSPIKYIDRRIIKAKKLPNRSKFEILYPIKEDQFDWSWHPDETEDPYIYVFGNNYWPGEIMPTIRYVVPGATQIKYIDSVKATLDVNMDNWQVPNDVDTTGFDFSWVPNPLDPAYIYEFGTQWQKTGGPRYVIKNATQIKYVDTLKSKALPTTKNWTIPKNIDIKGFDFSWHPDESSPPYIYVFSTQWAYSGGPIYTVPGATEVKYLEAPSAIALPDKTNWIIPEDIDVDSFDFSWHPFSEDDPYIYQFGTQWQKTGGPRYIVPGVDESSPIKYIDRRIIKAKKLPNRSKFEISYPIKEDQFDWSWHPDETEGAYIYVFGTQHQKTGGPRYIVEGATDIKYVDKIKAVALPTKDNWKILENVEIESFDYSWHPDITEEPYIYVFGNQWHKAEIEPTIEYHVPGATEKKYINDVKAIVKSDMSRWKFNYPIEESLFDFSWRPDPGSPPYIYAFGCDYYPVEEMQVLEYHVSGATDIKFVHDINAILSQDKSNWIIPENIDATDFDFRWRPNPKDNAYIYVAGTQHQKTGGPRYVVPGAKEIKYIDLKAKALPTNKNWKIPANIDVSSFDFSWHPDDVSPPYIYHFPTQWAITGGPVYVCEGAQEVKYVDYQVAKALPSLDNWQIPDDIDIKSFDFSWHPYAEDDPYIYQFGTQWQKTGGPRYIAPGTDVDSPIKYVDTRIIKAKKLPNQENFFIVNGFNIEYFDFSWHPDSTEEPYIYVFGNQWNRAEIEPTIEYRVPNATQVKYIQNVKAKIAADMKNWVIPDNIDINSFDFSWRPDPTSPSYIYEFATVWNNRGGPRYVVPGATDFNYVEDIKAKTKEAKTNWIIPENIDVSSFDFSWVPHPESPPYIYEFATVWNNRGGPRYVVPGASEFNYIEHIKADCKPSRKNWEIPEGIDVRDFDFSWIPHPEAPPYIYQFGTLENDNDGPRYIVSDNKGEIVRLHRVYKKVDNKPQNLVSKYYIETTLSDLVDEHPDEIFWAIRKNIDYSKFDFDWRPSIEQARYVHVFGSPDSEITQTYFVSAPMWNQGYRDFNFIEQKKADTEYLAELFVQPDIFLVDRGNPETKERFEQLKLRFNNVQKTRFLNTWVDTINRCINRSNTEVCWILNSELDYSNFDFKYYPDPWQMKMVHVFGTQWSHWGTTFMVNRDTFPEDTKYIKIIEHLSNLNFVKDRRAVATNNLYDIVLIDHGNKETNTVKGILQTKLNGKSLSVVPYVESYFKTIKNIVDNAYAKKENYLWICSSVCDYRNFDFSYICDPFAKDNLHVFPSDKQKFGDTFLIDVNKAKEVMKDIDILQSYHKVNYNQHQRAVRFPAPVIKTNTDTHVGSINADFDFPYAIFQTEEFDHKDAEPMNLWSEDTKDILVTSTGASRIIVPKEAKDYVQDQLYDYPYIKTASKLLDSKPLDIIFLSNGEKCADENYEHLLAVTKGLKNRIVRVDGVNGRVDAYHAAAKASQSRWAFTVFAKLKVNPRFDWNWQPDRLQIPKHYIFHAKNPLNGLEYGHQGMIAYNRQLVLNNWGQGLDFTLDDPHETVKILSGTATFNTDAFSTWRTAFREVIKLKSDYTDISSERLKIWLARAEGEFAQDCLQGANDAVEFYNECNGDIDQLRLSYEWDWLKDYYTKKYK